MIGLVSVSWHDKLFTVLNVDRTFGWNFHFNAHQVIDATIRHFISLHITDTHRIGHIGELHLAVSNRSGIVLVGGNALDVICLRFSIALIEDDVEIVVNICDVNTLIVPSLAIDSRSGRLLARPVSIQLRIVIAVPNVEVNRSEVCLDVNGGGVSFDFGTDKKKPILQKTFDYFVEVGAGCDFYFEWFKFCPQITYSIGFNNVLTPADARPELAVYDEFYTRALSKLLQRQITLTFNFE